MFLLLNIYKALIDYGVFENDEKTKEFKTESVKRVDDLGRIHIPKAIRQELKLKEGDLLQLTFNGNEICLRRI